MKLLVRLLLLLLPAQRMPERRVYRDGVARRKSISDGGVEDLVRIGVRRQFPGIDHLIGARQRTHGLGLFHAGSSSSIYILMISSKLASARKPSSRARCASKFSGQPLTMRMIAGSGSRRMRRAGASPATRRSAAICSATVTERPGIVRLRRGPMRSPAPAKAAAWSRNPTAARGD